MSGFRLDTARLARCKNSDSLAVVTLPPISATQLAFYSAAVGVTDPIHFDREFARRSGFPDLVVNGSLRVGWMAHVLNELVSPHGWLVRLHCSHRAMVSVGEALRYEVTYVRHEASTDGMHLVDVRVAATVDGQTRDVGEATLRAAAGSFNQ